MTEEHNVGISENFIAVISKNLNCLVRTSDFAKIKILTYTKLGEMSNTLILRESYSSVDIS